MPETIANIDLINVHELGFAKTQDPKEIAKHAYFLAANMLVAVSKHVRRWRVCVEFTGCKP